MVKSKLVISLVPYFTTTIKTVLVETDIYLIVLEPATGRNQADYPAKKYEYQCPFRTGLK